MPRQGRVDEGVRGLQGLALALVLLQTMVQAQGPDNRCFLETGGSAESFFVSEDLPVGSVVGTLHILGDPGPTGNIDLRLKELDSPVRIAPGSKNLTLTRKLDKEGIDGPASVYINIICDRRRTTVPGFVIPVSIRVTDVNDNAPKFINAPYILNISEVTVVGTRVLQAVKTVDLDQQGPFSTVQYSVLPGPNSDYFVFINELEGTIVLRKPLDYEALSNFTIGIRAQDQGNPPQFSDTQVHVNVIDADDQNPKFLDERYSAIVPDQATQGTRLRIQPREIMAYDQDVAINAAIFYSFNNENSDTRFFEIDRSTGHVIVKKTIPDDELLQPATLVVKATQYDNPDRYALSTLTVSRPGTSLKELQFLQSHYFAGVLESVPLNSVLLTVITNRHRDKKLRFWLDNYEDMFRVTPSGDIVLQKPLDFETQDSYVFQVHCTDGYMNATAQINISVLNVNDWDPRFRYLQYEFFVPDLPEEELAGVGVEGLVVGRVEVADGDRGDHVTLSLRGPSARMFSIDDSGEIRLRDLSLLNSSTAHLVAVATDNGLPPRQTSVPVMVHLPEAVVMRAGLTWPGTSHTLVVVFASILGLLGLIIVILILYIHKTKQPKSSKEGKAVVPIEPEKLPPNNNIASQPTENGNLLNTNNKIDNPVFNGTPNIVDNTMPQITSQYTATVKSIMARNSNTRVSQAPNKRPGPPTQTGAHKRQQAPAPPTVPGGASSPSPSPPNTRWPPGSIPRRVKKLSWDDESDGSIGPRNNKTELDPDVSVTPLTTDVRNDQLNLTVYF
ncbi:protocadherin Fat 2-like [Macrosteles quadrilineatus]|uniref:protocadherin Fat 2-like n=1 Tax=Macrosteles quadrilineatus TaxID=74068 RepID=UPI0023E10719|nr:protocadherin Fat 2-like [Macrosteles quadrilineatus]